MLEPPLPPFLSSLRKAAAARTVPRYGQPAGNGGREEGGGGRDALGEADYFYNDGALGDMQAPYRRERERERRIGCRRPKGQVRIFHPVDRRFSRHRFIP